MSAPMVALRLDAPNVAEFAQDMGELGPFTAAELATQFLDQYLSPEYPGTFEEAVAAFTPSCRYYV